MATRGGRIAKCQWRSIELRGVYPEKNLYIPCCKLCILGHSTVLWFLVVKSFIIVFDDQLRISFIILQTSLPPPPGGGERARPHRPQQWIRYCFADWRIPSTWSTAALRLDHQLEIRDVAAVEARRRKISRRKTYAEGLFAEGPAITTIVCRRFRMHIPNPYTIWYACRRWLTIL